MNNTLTYKVIIGVLVAALIVFNIVIPQIHKHRQANNVATLTPLYNSLQGKDAATTKSIIDQFLAAHPISGTSATSAGAAKLGTCELLDLAVANIMNWSGANSAAGLDVRARLAEQQFAAGCGSDSTDDWEGNYFGY